MKRNIVTINEELCNGCAACAVACHEGAIAMINGKAKLIKEDYCDGLGDCLPSCPTGAITIEEKEVEAYDQQAVDAHMKAMAELGNPHHKNVEVPIHAHSGCPGSMAKALHPQTETINAVQEASQSQLRQWPIQIKLVPTSAPYFDQANLLIAADCTAYAYASFHQDFIKNHICIIGCPKLDEGDYSEKLEQIIKQNDIKSVTIVRMEVPCCGGLEFAAKTALQNSGKFIPWQVKTISIDGNIID
ncbi:(Fe-S)-binding protein [Erysipelotrichaceae bacterium MTC7]|nr:(Fe-S)-binding protein [Erysipelotrichaceae bacterium MTC7]